MPPSAAPNLVIVESSAKSKIIEKYLNAIPELKSHGAFHVVASLGHIYELPLKTMGVDLSTWHAHHVPIPAKAKTLASLRTAIRAAKRVWLASDPDREGHAIARDLMAAFNLPDGHRVVFHEITPSALRDAFLHPAPLPHAMVDAQEARRILDRVTGYEASPLLWRRFATPSLSAGRVQSAALHMIVERFRAATTHVPDVFWTVQATFHARGLQHALETHAFVSAKTAAKSTSKATWAEAPALRTWLTSVPEKGPWALATVEKERTQNPGAPFTTSTLQQEAYSRHSLPIARTMQLAQALYEAGHITYMRTDSTTLSEAAQTAIVGYVKEAFGEAAAHPRSFATRTKNAQEAHEAIRPTDPSVTLSDIPVSDTLTEAHRKVYDLIWRRAVASQMAAARFAQFVSTITCPSVRGYEFRGAYDVLIDEGFLRVARPDERAQPEERVLWQNWASANRADAPPTLQRLEARADVTRPQPLFQESTLVKGLESNGIGRPSTYATTLAKLGQKGYTTRGPTPLTLVPVTHFACDFACDFTCDFAGDSKKKKAALQETEDVVRIGGEDKDRLLPTSLGERVADYLTETMPPLVDVEFTAHMEDQLDLVAQGTLNKKAMLDAFYEKFHPLVLRAQDAQKEARAAAKRAEMGDTVGAQRDGTVKGIERKAAPASTPALKSFDGVDLVQTRFGPALRMAGETPEKPKWISVAPFALWKKKALEELTPKDVMFLVGLPRPIAPNLALAYGRYGLYLQRTTPEGTVVNDRLPKELWDDAYEGTLTPSDLANLPMSTTDKTNKKKKPSAKPRAPPKPKRIKAAAS